MAQLLAPYNNSMRLGQGFNSYTQQICLDQAVLEDTPANRTLLETRLKPPPAPGGGLNSSATPTSSPKLLTGGSKPRSGSQQEQDLDVDAHLTDDDDEGNDAAFAPPGSQDMEVKQWVKPQIVTYSSRFVDKLSDVTDAMNISGSLSIKTATIGGKASGSYVDSDKFKSSDINFHLQVKVTNQILNAPNYNIFNKLPSVKKDQFAEVYGDSFISGWEEGGELNAVISMKVLDKEKLFEIKASLEAQLTTPSLSGEVKGSFELKKNELSKSTETTITVNWAGGGSIKDPRKDWDIATLKEAAAAFPELVAITPQRTYAILTKYNSLSSFHAQKADFSPLEYENAGIYTGMLLDSYMDYKMMWKQISHATYELEANRATISWAEPSEEINYLAVVKGLPAIQRKPTETSSGSGNSGDDPSPDKSQQLTVQGQKPNVTTKSDGSTHLTAFSPTFAGLIAAKKVCRFEMAKIVTEVDTVAKVPSLATDITRDAYFLNSLIFKQLLPVVRTLAPEDAKRGIKDPSAPIILGFNQHKAIERNLPAIYMLETELDKHDERLKSLFKKEANQSENYRMQGCAGPVSPAPLRAQIFSDLDFLDPTFRVVRVLVWYNGTDIKGIKVDYANQKEEAGRHGDCSGDPYRWISLNFDGSEIITEVAVTEFTSNTGQKYITDIAIATSLCKVLDTSKPQPAENGVASNNSSQRPVTDLPRPDRPEGTTKVITWSKIDDADWTFRGFFGFADAGAIITLGTIWGKDDFVPVPIASASAALCDRYLDLCQPLRTSIKTFREQAYFQAFEGKLFFGKPVSSPARTAKASTGKFFTSLTDLEVSWKIAKISFSADQGKLTGLKLLYKHGLEQELGKYNESQNIWSPVISSDLVMVKITAGKASEDNVEEDGFIDTVEFIRGVNPAHNGQDDPSGTPLWPLDVSTLRYLGASNDRVQTDAVQIVEKAPLSGGYAWCVRGFYGELSNQDYISKLGVIWGRG